MKMSDTGEKGNLSIKVKEEVMEEVDTFRYLGVLSHTFLFSIIMSSLLEVPSPVYFLPHHSTLFSHILFSLLHFLLPYFSSLSYFSTMWTLPWFFFYCKCNAFYCSCLLFHWHYCVFVHFCCLIFACWHFLEKIYL